MNLPNYPLNTNLEFVSGDSYHFNVRVMQNNEPIIMNDNSIAIIQIKTMDSIILTKTFDKTQQNNDGYVLFSLLPDDTKKLHNGSLYIYEIKFIFTPIKIITAMQGKCIIGDNIIKDV